MLEPKSNSGDPFSILQDITGSRKRRHESAPRADSSRTRVCPTEARNHTWKSSLSNWGGQGYVIFSSFSNAHSNLCPTEIPAVLKWSGESFLLSYSSTICPTEMNSAPYFRQQQYLGQVSANGYEMSGRIEMSIDIYYLAFQHLKNVRLAHTLWGILPA